MQNGMDLIAFDTKEELASFNEIYNRIYDSMTRYIHVGGVEQVPGDFNSWKWITTMQKLNYSLPFQPLQPDNQGGVEHCLTIVKHDRKKAFFNDINCAREKFNFICEAKWIEGKCPCSQMKPKYCN